MAYFNEFPHTRTYDSDLAWLIDRMKELMKKMDRVDELLAEVQRLIDELPEVIRQRIQQIFNELVENGYFITLIEELLPPLIEPFMGAFQPMTKTYEIALQHSDFSAIPSELTSLKSATFEIFENPILARFLVTSKWNPTNPTGLTFTNAGFFNVRVTSNPQTIEKVKSIPIKDPNGVSLAFSKNVGYAALRQGYWTNNNFTADKPCISNLTLARPTWLRTGEAYLLNGGQPSDVGNNGSIVFEWVYVKDTPTT